MSAPRVLIGIGSLCLLVASGFLVVGSAETAPWLMLAAEALGASILVVGLLMRRRQPAQPVAPDPERGERLVRWITLGLVGLGSLAVVVAVVVAVGEARGHAIFHLLTGSVCLGLFAALGFLWLPKPGGAAALRGSTLTLLAVAAFGAFLESLGGAGYDAANAGHRFEPLTTLHNAVTPFGALVMVAVPLAVVTGAVVLISRAIRRDPIGPTT